MQSQFHMRTGVVNHDLVYNSNQTKKLSPIDNSTVGELVNYVILQGAAKSIADVADMKYSL